MEALRASALALGYPAGAKSSNTDAAELAPMEKSGPALGRSCTPRNFKRIPRRPPRSLVPIAIGHPLLIARAIRCCPGARGGFHSGWCLCTGDTLPWPADSEGERPSTLASVKRSSPPASFSMIRTIHATCSTCQMPAPFHRRILNQPLHLTLTFLSLGVWALFWHVLFLLNRTEAFRCGQCGKALQH